MYLKTTPRVPSASERLVSQLSPIRRRLVSMQPSFRFPSFSNNLNVEAVSYLESSGAEQAAAARGREAKE
jgi:hypothetical protein